MLGYTTLRVFDMAPTLIPTTAAIIRIDFLSFLNAIIFAAIGLLVIFCCPNLVLSATVSTSLAFVLSIKISKFHSTCETPRLEPDRNS